MLHATINPALYITSHRKFIIKPLFHKKKIFLLTGVKKKKRRDRYKKLKIRIKRTLKKSNYLVMKKPAAIYNNLKYVTQPQKNILFLKRKFGLYKTTNFWEKRNKQKLFFLLNFIRRKSIFRKSKFIKHPRTLFYKRIKKLFFRAGRRVIMKHFDKKKQITQKYITKYLASFIRKPWTPQLYGMTLVHILIKIGLFFSFNDAEKFIKEFGVIINDIKTYDHKFLVVAGDFFFIIWTQLFLKFLKKKRKSTIRNLKKIKFYKFRAKFFFSKFRFNWIPTRTWVQEHAALYVTKLSNVEFDPRTLTGCYLYELDYINKVNMYDITTVSLYMVRSYNWKYIT